MAGLTRPHVQRTIGLNAALQALGLALGGNAGVRRGSLASLYRALKPWRTGDGRRYRQEPPVPRVATRSPRQATRLLLRSPEELSAADAADAAALGTHSPTLAVAAALAQRFLRLIREAGCRCTGR
jgi:hypothetical protein